MKNKILTLFFLFIVPTFNLQARMAVVEDASVIIEKANIDIVINNDGSSVETNDVSIRLKRKEAIDMFGTYKIYTTSDSEEIKVLSSSVLNEGLKVEVDPKKIQTKPIATGANSLTSIVETVIVFPQLKENSIINFRYSIARKKNDLSKLYSKKFEFGEQFVEVDSRLKITSPFKMYMKVNDPSKQLVTSDEVDSKGLQTITVSLKGPYINRLIEERGKLPAKQRTTVVVSRNKDWESVAKELSLKLNADSEENLPAELQKIVSGIPTELETDQKIKLALKYIITNYRYTGDWREFNGRMFPKKLDQLVKDKYGDCKDFTKLLVQLLSSLNIKADYALVNRSYEIQDLTENDLPGLDYFNHMIVRVQDGSKVYWVDPTNKLMVLRKIRKDIAERFALNLNGKSPKLEFISEGEPKESLSLLQKEYAFSSPMNATVSLRYKRSGEGAFVFQDVLKDKSEQEIEKIILEMSALGEHKVVTEFKSNLDHVEYKDIEASGKYIVDRLGEMSSKANIYNLPLPSPTEMLSISMIDEKNEGSIDLSLIPSVYNEYYYKKIFLNGEFPEVCEIKSDWIQASRKIDLREDGIVLVDSIKLLKKTLTKEDYQNKSFEIVSRNFKKCFFYGSLSYEFGASKHNALSEEFEKSLASLSLKERLEKRIERAKKALNNQSRGYEPGLTLETARLLLEKNIEEDPNDIHAYVVLSRYYLSSGYRSGNTYAKSNMDLAQGVLDKALSIDPNYLNAHMAKALVYFYQKKNDEVQKIINTKIIPHDKSTMSYSELRSATSLFLLTEDISNGILYSDLAVKKAEKNTDKAEIYAFLAEYYSARQDFTRCIEYYNQYIKFDDKDAWVYGNMSTCYIHDKKYDLAIESAKKAISIMDYGIARFALSYAYVSKGKEYFKEKQYSKSEEMYNNALLNNENHHIYLELIKVHSRQGNFEKASRDAQKAISLYEGPVSNVVGWIAQAFDSESPKYSAFMESALKEIENEQKICEVRYYVAYTIGMGKNKSKRTAETKHWIDSGLKLLTSIAKNETDDNRLVENQVLMINFHLLDAYATNSVTSLEKANELYNTAKKIDSKNPKIIFVSKYLEMANRAMRREPSSIVWKAKVFINKNLNIPIPDWLNEL